MRYALIYIIASQLVSLQDVFHLAVQFSKYIQVFGAFALRSLKTIQVQEDDFQFDHSALGFVDFFASFGFSLFRAPHSFRCDRPGMNPPISLWILSLERR